MTPRTHAVTLTAQALPLLTTDAPAAMRLLQSAAHTDPSFAPPFFHMANQLAETGALAAACVLYERCLALDPSNVEALVNCSHRAYYAGRLTESIDAAKHALDIDPQNAKAWTNLSLSLNEMQLYDTAIGAARRGFEFGSPDDPNHEMALAFAYLFAGDFAAGLGHFESRFRGPLKHTANFPWPRWFGDDIAGKTLVVYADQGIGDTVSFLRFVPALKARAKWVNLIVNPELLRLVSDRFAGELWITVSALGQPLPTADAWTSFMSLPFCLGLDNNAILAQTDAPWPEYRLATSFKRPARLHVGICWSGNPDCAIEKWRRVPLELLAPLFSLPDVAFYSLQVGESARDLYNLGFSACVTDCAPLIRDVADTTSLLRELDLVITTDTALAHIAGAAGKPTWVLTAQHGGDWRLGRGEQKPTVAWYPSMRLFKQDASCAWPSTIARVRDALLTY